MNRTVAAVLAVIVFLGTVAGCVAVTAVASTTEGAITLCGVLVASAGTLVTALIAAALAQEAKVQQSDNHVENAEKLDTIARRVNGELDERIESAVIRAVQPLLTTVASGQPVDQGGADVVGDLGVPGGGDGRAVPH